VSATIRFSPSLTARLAALMLVLAGSPIYAQEPLPLGVSAVDSQGAISKRAPRGSKRLAVVVHGINPVHSDLDPLCRDLVRRGYTVVRFSYDDGQRLDQSAVRLRRAIAQLEQRWRPRRTAIVAHSMGGLVGRRALTTLPLALRRRGEAPVVLPPLSGRFELVTVASPFGGFRSANWSRLDLGLGRPVFRDLGSVSRFIRQPGDLIPGATHVKIETTEGGHERRNGESDSSVRLRSQLQTTVDAAATERVRIDRGHVGAINQDALVPKEVRAVLARTLSPRRRSTTNVTPPAASRRPSRGLIGALGG
jgi:pimeloyl-ACP methyl ester carboxylesterase